MSKIIKWSLFSIGILGVLFWLLLSSNADMYSGILLFISYLLLIFTIGAILFFLLKKMIHHPKLLKKTSIFSGISLVVILVCYALTDEAPKGISASASAFVETGLYLFYFMTILAIGLMLYFAIKKILKR